MSGKTYIVIVCFPVFDVINFKIYHSFHIKPFFYRTKRAEQKKKIELLRWVKKVFFSIFFITFTRRSVARNLVVIPENEPLALNLRKINCCIGVFSFFWNFEISYFQAAIKVFVYSTLIWRLMNLLFWYWAHHKDINIWVLLRKPKNLRKFLI